MKFLNILENLENKYKNLYKCVIIGDPVEHSLSPVMHNTGYKLLHIDNKFIFDKITVKENEIEEFFCDLKNINNKYKSFVGITCTMPHKINVINYLDEVDLDSKNIKAVNSVLFNNGKYIGYNTDWYGIEQPFKVRNINLNNKNVAVLGAGGAAKSAVYALKNNGAIVNIFNRTKDKADLLAKEFDAMSFDLTNVDELKKNNIIINATSVGMGNLVNLAPIDTKFINKNYIVFECIYKPKKTVLIDNALKQGADVIYGWEMLLYQGVKQFELYTGLKIDAKNLRSVVE